MSFRLVIRSAAKAEFWEAIEWYESREVGLGRELQSEVESVFDRIVRMPTLHGIVRGEVRKAVVDIFPYCVY